MDTWILVADELHAALLVQSSVGSLHEIESWDCNCNCLKHQQSYVEEIARGIENLQTDFDSLVVAAPPCLLQDLSRAFGDTLNGRIAAELAHNLTHLSSRQLRTELQGLMAN